MDILRVLLVDSNPEESERIASMLSDSNYIVLPTSGLEEASEALFVQKFDAVLLGSPVRADELAAFTTTLRNLEKVQDAALRTPVLKFSRELLCAGLIERPSDEDIDGYLPENFDAAGLTEAMSRLSLAVSNPKRSTRLAESELPVLDPEEFKAQVCHDPELLVEIIDLFLAESKGQVAEMHQTLVTGDYELLYRIAHTIKGSLGSIHAAMARFHAEELEIAARDREEQVCRFSLAALQQDLDVLKPRLLSLREFPN